MLTLYGVTRSRASRIVWLCHELDLAFRQVPVIQAYRLADPAAPDAPLNTRSPEFLALSPAGAVPVIEDDGFVLSESLACTLYLARSRGGPLAPSDAQEEALMLQWSLYAATSVEPDALAIQQLHRPGQAQSGADQAAVASAAERLIRPLRVIEAHLARHGHPVGGRFTVADINLAEPLRYAQGLGALFEEFPATRSWLADCHARQGFARMWAAREAEPA